MNAPQAMDCVACDDKKKTGDNKKKITKTHAFISSSDSTEFDDTFKYVFSLFFVLIS